MRRTELSVEQAEQDSLSPNRREFLAGLASAAVVAVGGADAGAQSPTGAADTAVNIARVAAVTGYAIASENKVSAVNDGFVPENSFDRAHGYYALRSFRNFGGGGGAGAGNAAAAAGLVNAQSQAPLPWAQYEWSIPVAIDKVEVYWAVDRPRPGSFPGADAQRLHVPQSYRIFYWNGSSFVPVENAEGLGVAADAFNRTTFAPVTTTKVRLEVTPPSGSPAGILEWRVYNAGPVPALPPVIDAGVDRSVMVGARTFLAGNVTWVEDSTKNRAQWVKASGPGSVAFDDAAAPVTRAKFAAPGDYVLALTALGTEDRSHTIAVHVEAPPPKDRLDVVYTRNYAIDSPFWNERAKALIVNWIPHCIEMCERTDIAAGRGDGGLDNFIEAAKANRGEAHGRHKGYVFSNAWVHQTVESMCIALMVDAQGDAEIEQAQQKMRETLARWIPIILAAQMPDGYLQTAYILADRRVWPERWSPEHRGNHEGYVSGYFIESAINHYTLTDGKDLRLYDAAKRLADCWVANIGPGKKQWYDGHQEMEQALVRFGRFVNDTEGNHRGDAYIALAKFLIDCRGQVPGGSEYDQSHVPAVQQYEAVGHAVRAMYFYSGMADIAAETHDADYQSAVMSLWDNMVNKKYYVTGGIGSGETSEGFGPNYSLRNNAYCETCSSCGVVFFQYKLNLAYHDAKYADLYEETMYNALLGGVALDGKSYTYTNPLVNTERAEWHTCPCCVGNLSRTLLMVPTWAYAKDKTGLYVNMFVGSRIHVGEIAGVPVEVVQKTEYPWKGTVAIAVNPERAKTFSVYVRIPNRTTSKLYAATPAMSGVKRFAVNGKEVRPEMRKGYAVVTREWKAGDRIEMELPMEPQRVTADARIMADQEMTALKYGPLVYNVEADDNPSIGGRMGDGTLTTEWKPEMLGGVVAIQGRWADGAELVAIPNYARMNRVGPPAEYPGERRTREMKSKVWI